MKRVAWIMVSLLLSGCAAFASSDNAATLSAANSQYAAEATTIRETISVLETQILGTARAAETRVIERNSINQQLLATVRAGDPPTQQVIVVNPGGSSAAPLGDLNASGTSEPSGVSGGQFVDTVTTSRVRDSDGCADGAQSEFSEIDEQIFVVTRAVEVSAGTIFTAEWRFNGTVAHSDSWTVPNDERDFCIRFFLDTFSPGSWSVQLSANGTPITPAPSFTVTAADGS